MFTPKFHYHSSPGNYQKTPNRWIWLFIEVEKNSIHFHYFVDETRSDIHDNFYLSVSKNFFWKYLILFTMWKIWPYSSIGCFSLVVFYSVSFLYLLLLVLTLPIISSFMSSGKEIDEDQHMFYKHDTNNKQWLVKILGQVSSYNTMLVDGIMLQMFQGCLRDISF